MKTSNKYCSEEDAYDLEERAYTKSKSYAGAPVLLRPRLAELQSREDLLCYTPHQESRKLTEQNEATGKGHRSPLSPLGSHRMFGRTNRSDVGHQYAQHILEQMLYWPLT